MSEGNGSSSAFVMQSIFDEAMALFRRKNEDYGDAWQERGWMGNLARIGEKAQRLHTTLWHDRPVGFSVAEETARETVMDIMNTCAFFIANWDAGRRWGTEAMPPRSDAGWTPGPGRVIATQSDPAIVTLTADQTRQMMTEGQPTAPARQPSPHPRADDTV